MSIASIRTLRLLMPLSAITATLTQAVAIFTNNWLYTMELLPNESYERFKMPPEMEYHRKYTTSGMLELCQNEPPKMEMRCRYIDYFNQEEYIPDQNDSTMAIPYSMKRALAYIMASAAILLLGETIYLCRKLCGHRQIYTFLSGIAFILAGLTILAGLVVYISTFKGEVSNKLRPLSEFQDALFHYRYGFSFLMLVASLILCEVSGTLAIFLYIRQKQFKIMIDAEREEVLKKNILSLIAPNIKVVAGNTGDSNPVNTIITQPMLRIICEDENGVPVAGAAATSPVDHNFLSAEFGLDPSMYFCGRHGSRGRRNSRSNESFLGSSQVSTSESRSRKNSFTSMPDDTSQPQSPLAAENNKPKAGCDKVCDPALSAPNNSPPPTSREQAGLSAVVHELHVPSLAQLQSFREPMFTSVEAQLEPLISQSSRFSKKTRFQFGIPKSESQDISLPYILPMSTTALRLDENMSAVAPTITMTSNNNNSSEKSRNRLTKQNSFNINPNKSTFV